MDVHGELFICNGAILGTKQFLIPSGEEEAYSIGSWPFPYLEAFPGGALVGDPPANAGDAKRRGLEPWVGRSSLKGNNSPFSIPCLENYVDRSLAVTVPGGTDSRT